MTSVRRSAHVLAISAALALGFAWDHSRFGTMGSESEASNASLAFYGSLKAAPKTFIDLIVGTGYGTIDSTRCTFYYYS